MSGTARVPLLVAILLRPPLENRQPLELQLKADALRVARNKIVENHCSHDPQDDAVDEDGGQDDKNQRGGPDLVAPFGNQSLNTLLCHHLGNSDQALPECVEIVDRLPAVLPHNPVKDLPPDDGEKDNCRSDHGDRCPDSPGLAHGHCEDSSQAGKVLDREDHVKEPEDSKLRELYPGVVARECQNQRGDCDEQVKSVAVHENEVAKEPPPSHDFDQLHRSKDVANNCINLQGVDQEQIQIKFSVLARNACAMRA